MSLLDRLKQLFAEAKATPVAQEPIAPVAEVTAEGEQRQERRRKKRINAVPGTRVLIVDDSPTIVALLSRMLKQNQYTVLEAGDGEAALEIARRERPGLIFLDIVLPGMSGFTALRTLRHDPVTKDIPIIMISGNAQATEQFYVQRIGADNFMKKPFSRAEVFTYIERLLDEQFVPRRFNTFVHDTTLEPEEAEDQAEAASAPAAGSAAESAAEPATEAVATAPAAATESVLEAAAETPAAVPATVVETPAEVVVETAAIMPATTVETVVESVVETAAATPAAAPAAPAPVAASTVEQTTLSFAEMVEALIEKLPDEPAADSSPASPSAEPAPAQPAAPEPPARDIFADINAGWRRPVQRTPPPG